MGSIPGSGRCPGGGHGNPLQYSCLENAMDRGACWATVHRVAKSQTRLKRLSKHAHAVSCRCTAQRFMLVHGFPVAQLIKNPPVNAGDKEMQV